MDRTTLMARLSPIIARYLPEGGDPERVKETDHLLNDLHINSANLVDIILDVEDEFDIEIHDDAAEKMDTVGGALDQIVAAIKQK